MINCSVRIIILAEFISALVLTVCRTVGAYYRDIMHEKFEDDDDDARLQSYCNSERYTLWVAVCPSLHHKSEFY